MQPGIRQAICSVAQIFCAGLSRARSVAFVKYTRGSRLANRDRGSETGLSLVGTNSGRSVADRRRFFERDSCQAKHVRRPCCSPPPTVVDDATRRFNLRRSSPEDRNVVRHRLWNVHVDARTHVRLRHHAGLHGDTG